MEACSCDCADARVFVSTICLKGAGLTEASRVASGPPSACTSSLFKALRQGGLGMINGAGLGGSDTLHSPASDPQPAPLLRCHLTHPAQWQRCLYAHTPHFFSVAHWFGLPPPPCPLPQTTVRIPAEEEEPSSFGRNHLCWCAVDTGILFIELLSPVTLHATVFDLEHLKEKWKSSFRWHFKITFCTIWQSIARFRSVFFLSKC